MILSKNMIGILARCKRITVVRIFLVVCEIDWQYLFLIFNFAYLTIVCSVFPTFRLFRKILMVYIQSAPWDHVDSI